MAIFGLSPLRNRPFISQTLLICGCLICLCLLGAAQPLWATPLVLQSKGAVTSLGTGSLTLGTVSGVVTDISGNVYVTDTTNSQIVKIISGGNTGSVLSITGLSPALSSPNGMAIDSSGNLYVADTGNSRVVEVSPSGAGSVISTQSITLNAPQGVAADTSGDVFISDTGNSRIIKVDSGGTASVFTITGLSPVLSNQKGIAVDPLGNLYIADTGNSRVVKVSSAGAAGTPLTTVAGTSLNGPSGVAIGNNGVLYIADTSTAFGGHPTPGRVLIVNAQGISSVLLTGSPIFNLPSAVAVSSMGTLYVVDNGGTSSAGRVQSFQAFLLDTSNTYTSSVGFGHAQLGAAGSSITLPFNVGEITTLTSVSIYTGGTQNLDFAIANDSTCAASTTGRSCTVDVTFTPTAAGLRNGALVLTYTSIEDLPSGTLTVPLYGVADAPVSALSPAVASVVNIGSATLITPFQTAVDGAGNIYVTSYSGSKVTKIPAGSGSGTTVSTGSYTLSQPTGVALDAAGNLFIADYGNSRIIKVAAGGTASLFTITGLSTPIQLPTALAFDGAGNLYITDYGVGRMVEVSPYGQGTVLATGSITFAGTSITGSAVDKAGNVYIADRSSNRIVKVDPFGTATILSFSSVGTLNNPQGVAVDPSGNLYVMDSNNRRVILVTTSGTTSLVSFSGVTVGSFVFGISADANGNLLLADWTNNRVVKANVGQSTLTYANTNVGAASSDSPKTATVTNLGDEPLAFSAASGFTPDFSQNGADTNPCTASTTLAAGTSCDVSIKFTPQSGGSLSANITVTNNTLNVAGSTQLVAASGTGVSTGQSTATSVSIVPTSAGLGQAVTIAAQVTDTASEHTTTIPTGLVSFTDLLGATATQLSIGVTLDASGRATLSGIVLSGAGAHTITASYAGVSGTFVASNGTATININQAASLSLASSANPSIVTNAVSFSVAVTSSAGTPTGTAQFFDGTTLLGTGTLSGEGAAAYTTTALGTGSHSITAVYSGDSHFTGGTSSAVVQVVEDFTLGTSGTPGSGTGNVPSATALPGGTATYALSFGPSVGTVFPAPVTLSVSGLPPGATATLSPQTLPAGSGLTAVTLTIQLPAQTAELSKDLPWVTPGLALLFLPFAGSMRRKGYALRRCGLVFLLLAVGAGAVTGLSGCSAKDTGFFGQAQQTYTVLITGTSGSLSHSTSVTLTVQ